MQTAVYYKVEATKKIIDLLVDVANGRLEKDTKFYYNGLEYIYDGDDIHTVEADYYDGDVKTYLYLLDDIDMTNLNDLVIMSTMGYNLSFTSSVVRCPVCGGTGHVASGFYNRTGDTWISSTTAPEVCRSCSGKGYVKTYD